MTKLLSVVIPCYNSGDYMLHCVRTLLPAGDYIEILIIDDGSEDDTLAIASKLEEKYPQVVRAIHQDNQGHGGAIMTGINNAAAPYLKVVDSDDWVDDKVLREILTILSGFVNLKIKVDLVISNFIYDKVGSRHKRVIRYTSALPQGKVFGWDEVGKFPKGKYILMHSVIYRTELLKSCKMDLPHHTFYVDNLFVYVPMAKVETMYYINQNLYHYFIGREGQSVQEETMIKRIDQQILVNKLMFEEVDLTSIRNDRKMKYMFNYLEIITAVSTIFLIKSGTPENIKKKEELWKYIHDKHKALYRKLRFGIFGLFLNFPGRAGRWIAISGYKLAQKYVGFN